MKEKLKALLELVWKSFLTILIVYFVCKVCVNAGSRKPDLLNDNPDPDVSDVYHIR